jgi:hypothetical protein
MAKRKTFDHGQEVEVQLQLAGRWQWEPATYGRISTTMSSISGYHWVTLPEDTVPIYTDPMSGLHYTEADREGRRYRTFKLLVPSVRIRARKAVSR